jgi:membrane-associated phospholipid phosphatase
MKNLLSLAFSVILVTADYHSQTEASWLHSINKNDMPAWDAAMKNLSFSVYVIEPIPPVAIALHGYAKKDKALMWNGYKSAMSLCGALVISTTLKYTVNRLRPYQRFPELITRRDFSETPSFPSGHTTAAFVSAANLTFTYRKWYVALPAYTYAGMVAYSRMRLGMHWPTDVIGGMVLGTGTACLVWWLERKIRMKRVQRISTE